MKRIVLIVAMLYAMSFCRGVAYADNTAAYIGGENNTARITNASDYSTVCITKDSDGSVVYVNQTNGVFDAAMDFLIKDNPSTGLYNVWLGRKAGTTASTTFYIGVDSNNDSDTPMTRLSYTATTEEDDTTYYTAGFSIVTNISDYLSYKTLKVGYNNGDRDCYGGFDLNEHWNPAVLSGEGSIMLVFVLNHIEADELPTVSVFLSKDTLGNAPGYVE